MKTIFENKNRMIPESLQPLADRIGLTLTGLAAYMNIKLGFMHDFTSFIISPIFNSFLAIVISFISIIWILMKIYDQYLVTKERKEAKNGKA